jgi:hypothetical protein
MIGAFLAFGTPSSLAILAVLSYRLISFWLPTVPVQSRISNCGAPSGTGGTRPGAQASNQSRQPRPASRGRRCR